MAVKINGGQRLQTKLKKIKNAPFTRPEFLTKTNAEFVYKHIKKNGPKKTGSYLRGIKLVRSKGLNKVLATAPHSVFVEYGTVKWKGHAPIRKAIIALRNNKSKKQIALVRSTIQKNIK